MNKYKILFGKSGLQLSLDKPRRRWQDNINIALSKCVESLGSVSEFCPMVAFSVVGVEPSGSAIRKYGT
jgi:hypothetical protein